MGKYIEEVKIVEYDGRKIFGKAYLPETEEICPIVIFSHGYNNECESFKGYGEFLAANGVAAYCYDFCGGAVNSKSSMKTTEMTIDTEKDDLEAVIKAVKQWDKVDENRVFLFGESQGGLVTCLVAESHIEDISGVILIYPALCIADDWTRKYEDKTLIPEEINFWGMELGGDYIRSVYKFDVMKHIGGYDKNILIMHGDKDPVVSPDCSFRAAKQYKHAKVEIFNGEVHGFTEEGNNKAMRMTLKFVQDNIEK